MQQSHWAVVFRPTQELDAISSRVDSSAVAVRETDNGN